MAKNFLNSIQLPFTKSNTFDLTHDVKLSCLMGNLYPILSMEVVPGDRIQIGCESLIRFAPMVSPVMHRMDVTMHYFFVPNRLTWPNWEKFITGDTLYSPGSPTPPPAPPFITVNGLDDEKTLANYMGIPLIAAPNSIAVNALPFAAYQCVWNEYYRDQNVSSPISFQLADGDNGANGDLKQLRIRAWEHDYFTSALPFAQKGPAVDIPLGDVQLKANWNASGDYPFMADNAGNPQAGNLVGVTNPPGAIDAIETGGAASAYDPNGSLQTQATTINDLRRSFRLQEWLEKNARGGTRYIENILAHFGVKSSDARLNRPEYITGSKSPVVISEVLNTTGTTLPQGNMAGHGISVTSGKQGSYYCEEHGYIIGVMSVLPKPAYQQGIPKHFLKFDRLDYFWPSFANIGEQEIKNEEVYYDPATVGGTFGYIPRYGEYKFMQSRVAGEFQTNLDFWHMGRIFANPPLLNEQFILSDPTKRIFAVTAPTTDDLYCHVLNKIYATRKMPKYGTPTF